MQTRILIVDDDTRLGGLLRDYLEPYGFDVDLAHTGPEGLERAVNTNYAAIILDVMLPGMDGYQVLKELRTKSSTPVLMFTALGAEPDRIAGLDVGADDYLPKTFSTTELLARLRALIRRSSLTGQQRKKLEDDREALDQALDIQRALLPRQIPPLDGVEIAGVWLPAKTVSGDYYDVFPLDADRIAICIGDVSGKGIPAALLMANVQAAVKAFAPQNITPAELCRRVNGILYGNATPGRYVSFFYAVLEQKMRRLVYTCAGHNPPILIRRDGSELRLTKGGTLLGVFPHAEFEIGEVTLNPGDRLVLFTDGVTEGTDAQGSEFGEERLFQIVRNGHGTTARALADSIIDAVARYCGNAFQDDVTLVTLKVLG